MTVISPLTKTLRRYNLNQVKFLVGPPRRTTEWAKATLGFEAVFDGTPPATYTLNSESTPT